MERETLYSDIDSGKEYKHFTTNTVLRNVCALPKGIVFLYIGQCFKKIDLLVKTFESGFAADTIEQGIAILNCIHVSQNAPDVIIIDSLFTESSLKELHHFLQSDVRYAGVPCVLDASELPEAAWKKYRNSPVFDDIVFLNTLNNEKTVSKFQFLKKVKKHTTHYIAKGKIEVSSGTATHTGKVLKRLFDITVSSVAILLLSPVLLLIALALKIESGGPVFYIAKRAGKGYRIFNFIKFRTMVVDADKNVKELAHLNQYNAHAKAEPVFFKMINDPRITKVGAVLRKTSLDELPQFINVLMGDMSLVGNRPLPLSEAAALTTDQWAARFMAPAGITGLWQISKADQHEMSVEKRLEYDIVYAHKSSFMYDLWILAHTPSALIKKSNV